MLIDKNKSSGPDISMGEALTQAGALRIDFAEIRARAKNLSSQLSRAWDFGNRVRIRVRSTRMSLI